MLSLLLHHPLEKVLSTNVIIRKVRLNFSFTTGISLVELLYKTWDDVVICTYLLSPRAVKMLIFSHIVIAYSSLNVSGSKFEWRLVSELAAH